MKAHIRKNTDGEFANPNFAVAYAGFRQLGWEIVPYYSVRDELTELQADEVVVGYIDDVRAALMLLEITPPPGLSYPEELASFLDRKIWKSQINYIAKHPEQWNIFVKPTTDTKKFTGRVVRTPRDLIGCGDESVDTEIWCSEPVKFLAEWRCFVTYNEILNVRLYKGDWALHFDPQVIRAAVAVYTSAPASYAIDFGVTAAGKTLLVEVNEGYSVGSYGLFPTEYARFLSARWAQMTGSRDYCQ
jgi:hypothetical protein